MTVCVKMQTCDTHPPPLDKKSWAVERFFFVFVAYFWQYTKDNTVNRLNIIIGLVVIDR